jgi:putative transcriptional regulator
MMIKKLNINNVFRSEGSMNYKLKAKRVEKGIKQNEFARKLNITVQYLCKIEKGEVEPRRNLMIVIANELGTTPQQLFFEDDIEKINI